MSLRIGFVVVLAALECLQFCSRANAQDAHATDQSPARKLILAHYMPWFVANENERSWGWHWTMNTFDPNVIADGKRAVASHFYPLIGPYDSGDSKVLEFHLLTMKMAGIDGVIVDWYGLQDFRDYKTLHQNTQRLIEHAERLGMAFAICYEDQTVPALVAEKKLDAANRISHTTAELDWLAKNWFSRKCYVKVDSRPLLLSFGQDGLTDAEWQACLSRVATPVAYFSQHHQRKAAVGAFDWPSPKEGTSANTRFLKEATNKSAVIPVAFPRFVDIYAEAKVHPSWGRVEDQRGETFKRTLQAALNHDARIVQIATWNDWGEGTMIEPSVEFGYRDLEIVQRLRREKIDSKFVPREEDLLLPKKLFELQQKQSTDAGSKQLDVIAKLIADLELDQARRALNATFE